MKVRDITDVLERMSPPSAACDWDNVGLMAGDKDAGVSRVLVTLDVDEAAIDKAVSCGADMIVSHHPLIFGSIKNVTCDSLTGSRLVKLLGNKIACFSMHTNFDICGSMGSIAADTLGLRDAATLEVTMPDENGLGKVAEYTGDEVITAGEWASRVMKSFELDTVKVFGDMERPVRKIAIYPGSGSGAIKTALMQKVDLLVTGDIGHHAGIDAKAEGLTVIDAGHYGIEHVFIKYIAGYIGRECPGVDIVTADICSPFEVLFNPDRMEN